MPVPFFHQGIETPRSKLARSFNSLYLNTTNFLTVEFTFIKYTPASPICFTGIFNSESGFEFYKRLNSAIHIPEIFTSLQHFSIGGVFYPFQDFGVKLTAIMLILLLTSLNISGLKSGAGVSKAILFMVFKRRI